MKFRIPAIYDKVMDSIAVLLFPSKKYITATLITYTIIFAALLFWYTGNWLWVPATVLGMALAAMMIEWFF